MALTDIERQLMQQVKDQGGSMEDGREVLTQFREQQAIDAATPPEPEDKTGIAGVGQEIAEFGKGLKFESEPESSLGAVGQFVGNIPGDAIELIGDVVQIVGEPIETSKNILQLSQGVLDNVAQPVMRTLAPLFGVKPEDIPENEFNVLADAVGDEIVKTFGNAENFKKAMRQNPVDTLLIFSPAAKGASTAAKAKGFTKTAAVFDKLSRVTDPVNIAKTVVASPTKKGVDLITNLGKKATGLSDDTLKTIQKAPDEFTATKAKGADVARQEIATGVFGKIEQRLEQLAETGKEFEKVRGIKNVSTRDDILKAVDEGFEEIGIKRTDEGLSFGDTSLDKVGQKAFNDALDEIQDIVQNKPNLSSDDLLNMRRRLDSIIPFDAPGTAKDAVKIIRGKVDDIAKDKIEGLKEIDAKFADEITELKGIRQDFFKKDGALKDNAISKVANLTNKGNELRLQRVKDIFKGTDVNIEQAIKVLKAVEDAEALNKVGTYLQSLAVGGLAFGATSNPLGMLLGLLSIPGVGEFLAKTVGKSKNWFDKVKAKLTPEFIEKHADTIKKINDEITALKAEALVQTEELIEEAEEETKD